MTAVITWYK